MATSLAIAVLATKRYRGQALAQSIAERTQCHVVPLTRPDPAVLHQCCTVLIESDMNLHGDLELIRAIMVQNPDAVVIVLGSAESAEDIAKLAEAGASGYIPADADLEEMLAIVQSAAKGQFICPPQINHKLFRQLAVLAQNRELCVLQDAGLTTRERQVLNLLRHSLDKREIADRLCVSECTIKSHVHRVRRKLANDGPFSNGLLVENRRSLHLQARSQSSTRPVP
jgi:DNA-binding NarL/FixJ family response regulator